MKKKKPAECYILFQRGGVGESTVTTKANHNQLPLTKQQYTVFF